jgi:hypothetical protein
MTDKLAPLEVRFWAKVDKTETCWNWTASKCRNGYGRFGMKDKVPYSHRVSYEMVNGPIPAGMELDHTCHNRACVRPEHLRPVTHQQNLENRSGAQSNSASGIRGVSWHKAARKWSANVRHGGSNHYLGLFADMKEAETVAIAKRNELHTHNSLDRRVA